MDIEKELLNMMRKSSKYLNFEVGNHGEDV
jgi:hypothetical protein